MKGACYQTLLSYFIFSYCAIDVLKGTPGDECNKRCCLRGKNMCECDKVFFGDVSDYGCSNLILSNKTLKEGFRVQNNASLAAGAYTLLILDMDYKRVEYNHRRVFILAAATNLPMKCLQGDSPCVISEMKFNNLKCDSTKDVYDEIRVFLFVQNGSVAINRNSIMTESNVPYSLLYDHELFLGPPIRSNIYYYHRCNHSKDFDAYMGFITTEWPINISYTDEELRTQVEDIVVREFPLIIILTSHVMNDLNSCELRHAIRNYDDVNLRMVPAQEQCKPPYPVWLTYPKTSEAKKREFKKTVLQYANYAFIQAKRTYIHYELHRKYLSEVRDSITTLQLGFLSVKMKRHHTLSLNAIVRVDSLYKIIENLKFSWKPPVDHFQHTS